MLLQISTANFTIFSIKSPISSIKDLRAFNALINFIFPKLAEKSFMSVKTEPISDTTDITPPFADSSPGIPPNASV